MDHLLSREIVQRDIEHIPGRDQLRLIGNEDVAITQKMTVVHQNLKLLENTARCKAGFVFHYFYRV